MLARPRIIRLALAVPALVVLTGADDPPKPSTQCAAAKAAVATLPGGLDTAKVCAELEADWSKRTSVPNPPRRFDYTAENPAFASALAASIKEHGRRRPVVVDLSNLPKKASLSDLRTARAPNYTETELGIWLDRISDHDGVKTQTDSQGLQVVPLLFEWFGRPLFRYLTRRNPYGRAKDVDAVVVTYGSGPDAGMVRRICFVPKGRATGAGACPDGT